MGNLILFDDGLSEVMQDNAVPPLYHSTAGSLKQSSEMTFRHGGSNFYRQLIPLRQRHISET